MRFRQLFNKRKQKRLFVLSLDGVPYSFLINQIANGHFPYLGRLLQEGGFKRMHSSLPPVSSVAWSCYMTGKNPAGHNIFGFVERDLKKLRLYIPTGDNMKSETIWGSLSNENKKVVVINVPVTSPPKLVNGILIACFLSPSLDRAVYPVSLIPQLKEWGYQIDVDAERARHDRAFFLEEVNRITKIRLEVAMRLMEDEEWDFFHLHIMDTDRMNHFLWKRWEDKDPCFAPAFEEYYRSLDRFIGETLLPFLEKKGDTHLMILSDHGFCRLKKEVFLNYWLLENEWLKLKKEKAQSPADMDSETRAYSLIPGRIYLNLKGREPEGSIDPEKEYKETLEALKEGLLTIEDPETGEKIVDKIFMRDDIYHGPYISQSPDMVVLPKNGYDLKGNLFQPSLIRESELEGMHTYDDAFLFIKDFEIQRDSFSILDVTPTVFKLLGSVSSSDLDGHSLI